MFQLPIPSVTVLAMSRLWRNLKYEDQERHEVTEEGWDRKIEYIDYRT